MDSESITNETRLTRIQALVVDILRDLLRAPIESADTSIQSAIARIGAWCRRDRSYVFVLKDGCVSNTHEWCGVGIEPAIDDLQGIPWEGFGPITEPLERGEAFHVPDIAELEPGSPSRQLLEMQQIRSILVVPMRHDGAVYGFIGFDGVEHTHTFLPGELYLLQSVADVIGTVLIRRDRERAVARAQEELAQERAFLASVLATSAMGILVIGADGVISFANDAAVDISGMPRSELVGKHHAADHFRITRVGGEPFGPGTLPFDLVSASGAAAPEIRFELHCPEGIRYCAIHAAPVTGDPCGQARVVYAMLDVTEHVLAERARAEALDEARRANAAKSNFLAKMSHEMRTPLNGVLGIAEVLERQITSPEQRRMVGVLHESGNLLLNIINDLLDMTKIEADRLQIESIPFNLVDLAQRLEAVHTLKAAERRLSFGVHVQGDGRALRRGDPHRLMQILHNLIGNAVKFTEEGSVLVEIDCSDPARLTLEVRDTGIGMTPEAIATIFDDFEQADSSIARRFGGTGLGMAIVRGLVGMMGGCIELDSAPRCGTRVRIDLPIPLAPEAEPVFLGPADPQGDRPAGRAARRPRGPGAAGAAAGGSTVAPSGLPDMSRLRVLAADDNRTNRMILGAMLGQLGVSPEMVNDGQSALDRFDRAGFDVVILDISMPDMDGVAVMHEMRRRLGNRPAPRILAFTANAMSHQVDAYLQAGFDACLTKPLQLPALLAGLTGASGSGPRHTPHEGARPGRERPGPPVAAAR